MSSAVQRATVLSGTVTRTWLVPYEGATHFAQLRHNTVSGFRYAMFDGRELPGTEGTSTILSQSGAADVLVVKLGEAALEVTIAASHGVFVYGCTVDGKAARELNEVPEVELPFVDIDVRVATAEVMRDDHGKNVAFYRVEAMRRSDHRAATTAHRFSEFHELDSDLRSAFVGTHVLGMFPPMPKKAVSLFTNHLAPDFIESRRTGLELYLRRLVGIRRVTVLPELLIFLNLSDKLSPPTGAIHARQRRKEGVLQRDGAGGAAAAAAPAAASECPGDHELGEEVAFTFAPGPLGMRLKERQWCKYAAYVACFVPDKDGGPGQAERGSVVQPGDVITRVSGAPVHNLPYDEVVMRIKAAPRPLQLHLRGWKHARRPGLGGAGAGASPATAAAAAAAAAPPVVERVGDVVSAPDGGATVTVGSRKIAFSADEVAHFDHYMRLACPDASMEDDGSLPGTAAAKFMKKSELSARVLQEVWRVSCGGQSQPQLKRAQWFVAMKLITLAQQTGSMSLDDLMRQPVLPLPAFTDVPSLYAGGGEEDEDFL